MKLLIIVPSKGRPQAIVKKTLSWLPEAVANIPFAEWKVIVEPQDRLYYQAVVHNGHLLVLPDNDKGLGYSLRNARDYAIKKGCDLIMHVDDDVRGWIDHRKKIIHTKEVFTNMIIDIVPDFEIQPDLALVRFVSARSLYFTEPKKYINKNQGAWGCYIIRLSDNHISDEYRSYSDTGVHLWIWKNGKYTLSYGLSAINVEVYGNEGGCNMTDRKQNSIDSIAAIKKDFPEVFMEDAKNSLGYDINISYYRKPLIKKIM